MADIIGDAHEVGTPLLMMVINAAEVWYIVAREASVSDAETCVKQIRDLGIRLIDADWDLAKVAGHFKSQNKMSFADCFAAALAKQHKAFLVTGDPEFKQIEPEVAIEWLPQK